MGGKRKSKDTSTSDTSWLLAEQRRLEQAAARLDEGRELDNTLAHLVRTMAEALSTDINSILLVDEDASHLLHGASVGLPDEYVEAIKRVPIGPEGRCCGVAAFSNDVVIIEDMHKDPRWTRCLDSSDRAGLGAVWSVPIRSKKGEVLGTFATYYREPHSPNQQEIELAQAYARHAAIAIEIARSYDAAQRDGLNLETILEQMPEGVIIAQMVSSCS